MQILSFKSPLAGLLLVATACSGPQSALDPAGRQAGQIASLFGWMALGAVLIWLGVLALGWYAVTAQPRSQDRERARFWIIGGGALVPTLLLAGLLTYALSLLSDLVAPAPEGSLTIEVSGEQWWWRVRYLPRQSGDPVVELANEIHLPVNEPVEFRLLSPDVIHAFWIPSLGGKVDMIPGRTNRLSLHPTRTGTFRGVCAEYCGTSHALMSFLVVVQEKEEFDRWLAEQRRPALSLTHPGGEAFLANGCGACHTVRGTPADGVIGPDLTHVGSRLSLGAGILPNDQEAFRRWIGHTERVKPGAHMPGFGMLGEQLTSLGEYLDSLQ